MEPTSVAAISTGGPNSAADTSGGLPASVRMVLDAARPATARATLVSLDAALRGPAMAPTRARSAVTVAPATLSFAARSPRHSALHPARWISTRVIAPMAALVVGVMVVMAWIG